MKNAKRKLLLIIKKWIDELFIDTVHNINKKDYSKEQLNA